MKLGRPAVLLLILPIGGIACKYEAQCRAFDGTCNFAVTHWLFRGVALSPAGNPNATAPSSVSGLIFLFRTTSTTTGLLGGVGGRSGADNFCASSRSFYAFPDNSCTSVRAFISIIAGDQISNIPANYGVPTANQIQGPTGTLISPSWAPMLGGTISSNLQAAGVLPPATAWVSYSTAAGTLAGNHCNNGTATGLSGQVGNSDLSNAQWMDNGTGLCILGSYALCLCY